MPALCEVCCHSRPDRHKTKCTVGLTSLFDHRSADVMTADEARLENALRAAVGRRSCIQNWNANTGQHCGRPAIVHILGADGHCVMVCVSHVAQWNREPRQDHHTIGGACGLPDAGWLMSGNGHPGRCVIDGLDIPDLFADERTQVPRV